MTTNTNVHVLNPFLIKPNIPRFPIDNSTQCIPGVKQIKNSECSFLLSI